MKFIIHTNDKDNKSFTIDDNRDLSYVANDSQRIGVYHVKEENGVKTTSFYPPHTIMKVVKVNEAQDNPAKV